MRWPRCIGTAAMFDLAIDSKLRGCDVVKVKIGELVSGGRIRSRAIVIQQKTGRPVQFRAVSGLAESGFPRAAKGRNSLGSNSAL